MCLVDVGVRAMFIALAACGGATRATVATPVATERAPEPHHLAELESEPLHKLLAIDWSTVAIASDADALALWAKIAPTGDDWDRKVDEIPPEISRALAGALLREGNFRCAGSALSIVPCGGATSVVPDPAADATLADPCLRRVLALWALGELEPDDVPRVRDALRAIAAIPPPESQLVAAAVSLVPDSEQDARLELVAIAWAAGQRELVDHSLLAGLDDAHRGDAATRLHIDGALDGLTATMNRAVFLHAVTDEMMVAAARISAIDELLAADDTPKLSTDLRAALVAAANARDCGVAAAAVRALDVHGDRKLLPVRPHTRAAPVMMRGLCVLASYERGQRADQASLLPSWLPARGLELVRVSYDALSDDDADGDGDVHTVHRAELIARADAVLPDIDDLVRALAHCDGTTCTSEHHRVTFGFKPGPDGELRLARLEIAELPPCS